MHQRHMNARQHFSQLSYMAKYMSKNYVEGLDGRLVQKTGEMMNGSKEVLPEIGSKEDVMLSISGVNITG